MILGVIKLLVTMVTIGVMVSVILRVEKKLFKRVMAQHNNINVQFVERIGRFIFIFLAFQFVIMSSSLTQPFGRVLFQGTTVIAAIAGFAAQPVIADLICGLMISTTRPFNIGDRIELEDGSDGIVKDITLRHVVLQDIDTVTRIIPNSKLNGMKIANMSYHTQTRSVHMRFNVSFDCDVMQAMTVIADAVKNSPYSVPGKPVGDGLDYGPVYFIQYAESSIVMATTVYYNPGTPTEVLKSDVNLRVKQALDGMGIEIPYNYVNVVMKNGEA